MTPSTNATDATRAPEVRERIVDAACDILADRGLDGLSMRGVAERVGLTATALYHYFDNKDALVSEVVASGFREFGRYLQHAARVYPAGSLDRVRALGEGYIRFALENEAYFRVLFSVRHPPRGIEDLPEGGGYELLRQAIVAAMDAGAMRRAEPDLVAMYLWSLVHGIVTISLTCHFGDDPDCAPVGIPASPIDLFHAFSPFVREGIRAPSADARG